jgi:hypothetical protein
MHKELQGFILFTRTMKQATGVFKAPKILHEEMAVARSTASEFIHLYTKFPHP